MGFELKYYTMTYNPSVRYEVDCDVAGIATSQQVSCLGRMKNGVLDRLHRRQSMAVFAVSQFLLRIGQRSWTLLLSGHAYIAWLITCLFRFVYSVFSLLGTAFLFSLLSFQLLYFYTLGSFSVCKFCIASKDHLAYLGFGKTQSKAWFADNSYKFSFAPLELMRYGV
jgi:hypothetical protein